MKQSINPRGGVGTYAAPALERTAVAVDRGFAASTTNEAFYDSQEGITQEDYVWGGTLDEEWN